MRIGRGNNSLVIEKRDPGNAYSPWRVEALAAGSGGGFSAVHDRMTVDTSEQTVQPFADFEALRTQRVEIALTGGGWFRLERDARGYITVGYRLAGWKVRAVLEGEVVVEGEFTGGFCREFRTLLENAR